MDAKKASKAVMLGYLSKDPVLKKKAKASYNRIVQMAGTGDPTAKEAMATIRRVAAGIRNNEAEVLGVNVNAAGPGGGGWGVNNAMGQGGVFNLTSSSWQGPSQQPYRSMFNTQQQYNTALGQRAAYLQANPTASAHGGVVVASSQDSANASQYGLTDPTTSGGVAQVNKNNQIINQIQAAQSVAAQYGVPGPQTAADLAAWPAQLQALQSAASAATAAANAPQPMYPPPGYGGYGGGYGPPPPQYGGGYAPPPPQYGAPPDDGSNMQTTDDSSGQPSDGGDVDASQEQDEIQGYEEEMDDPEESINGLYDEVCSKPSSIILGDDLAQKVGQSLPAATPLLTALTNAIPIVGPLLQPLDQAAVLTASTLLNQANNGDQGAVNQIKQTAAQAAAGDPNAAKQLDALQRVHGASKALKGAVAAKPFPWRFGNVYQAGVEGIQAVLARLAQEGAGGKTVH
jgi:hypothetical protein